MSPVLNLIKPATSGIGAELERIRNLAAALHNEIYKLETRMRQECPEILSYPDVTDRFSIAMEKTRGAQSQIETVQSHHQYFTKKASK